MEAFKKITQDMVFVKYCGIYQVWKHSEPETVYFRAKSIIMANGGAQQVHPMFFNWFPSKEDQKEKVITSDFFLKKDGFIKTMK